MEIEEGLEDVAKLGPPEPAWQAAAVAGWVVTTFLPDIAKSCPPETIKALLESAETGTMRLMDASRLAKNPHAQRVMDFDLRGHTIRFVEPRIAQVLRQVSYTPRSSQGMRFSTPIRIDSATTAQPITIQ